MLKVGSPRPQVEEPVNMPPPQFEEPSMDIGNNPEPYPDENEMPMEGGDMANPYEADFDAGVDANEDDDPKRYIQQLTGKLSQSLRKYQEGLPTPDTDLDKYVAGMILKQATDGLNDEDTKDVLGKIKGDDDVDECRTYRKNLSELTQNFIDNDEEDEFTNLQRRNRQINFKSLPFTAPDFD